jgi:Zn finger protein HypA/HybF involved in hydrogenase expression
MVKCKCCGTELGNVVKFDNLGIEVDFNQEQNEKIPRNYGSEKMMIDIAERKVVEKCNTCGNEKESKFWDYCPFCGDSFPESHSNRRRRK